MSTTFTLEGDSSASRGISSVLDLDLDGEVLEEFDGDASIPLVAASALANCCKQSVPMPANTLPLLTQPRAPNMKREDT